MLDMMEYESALERYQSSLALDAQLRDVRKKMAYAHLQLGQTDEALSLLREELTFFRITRMPMTFSFSSFAD